jgi:3-hydroxyisobutyrate dehydrogenase-like beta-hydroxyacid dehydrogenase
VSEITSREQPRVGLAGLGGMGRAMAGRLAGAGMLTAVYNRTWSTCRAEADHLGVKACATAAELATACDILVTMISDDRALYDVYEGEAGVLQAIRPGTLCVEMSTTGPPALQRLAVGLEGRGCALVDAPVSGSTQMAASGQLTILVGGDQQLVDRARPVFERLGHRTFHVGPLGSGAAMKLAVNNVVYGLNQSVAESLVLAERAGIDRLIAYDVFAHSAVAAPFVHYRRQLFEQPDRAPAQMRLGLAAKDLSLIEAMASSVGADLPQAAVNHRVLQDAAAAGHSDRDVTAVAEHLRNQPSRGDNDG